MFSVHTLGILAEWLAGRSWRAVSEASRVWAGGAVP